MTTKVTSSVLANTAVTAGTYGGSTAIPVIIVDSQGRLSSAANVTITQTAVYANTGQLTANAATGVVAVGLATSGVTSGTYGSGNTISIVTIDTYGRITGVSNTLVTSVSPSYTGGQGGSAGQILYQSAANTTSNTDVGTTNYLLTSNGTSKPTWTNPGSLSVNAANTANALAQGLWTVANTSNKLVFSYNSVSVFSIDSSGNMIAKGDITGFGTP